MQSQIQTNRHRYKLAALILAFVSIWMSGIAQLRHTDNLGDLRTYHVRQQTLCKTTSYAEIDTCAACDWDWLFSQPQAPTFCTANHLVTIAKSRSEVRSQTDVGCFDFHAQRGPPFLIS